MRRARRHGIVLVASAGNSGRQSSGLDAPARYPETLAVAATTRANRAASFSSRGNGIAVAAPGANILSTWLNGGYARLSGTSMSAPHVTGGSALLRGAVPPAPRNKTRLSPGPTGPSGTASRASGCG